MIDFVTFVALMVLRLCSSVFSYMFCILRKSTTNILLQMVEPPGQTVLFVFQVVFRFVL